MEVYDQREKGYIAVWLTNQEQRTIDRPELTKKLLSEVTTQKKCKVVFFLSGREDLYEKTEGLLLLNAKC